MTVSSENLLRLGTSGNTSHCRIIGLLDKSGAAPPLDWGRSEWRRNSVRIDDHEANISPRCNETESVQCVADDVGPVPSK
jgi:hypothetical protein